MGVRGLFSFLKPKSTYLTLESVKESKPLRIGVDISYYIYKWQSSSEKVLAFIESLKPHKVILIFDGRAPDEKQQETNRRRTIREDDIAMAKTLRESINSVDLTEQQKAHLERTADQYERRGWQNTKEIRHAFKEILYKNKIPLLKSKGEADSLLVSMAVNGELDVVISGDMDLLVLGLPLQWCPNGDGISFREFRRETILDELGLSDIQFRSFCAMCSTDYTQEEQYLDIRTAYHGIRVFKTIKNVEARHPEWLKEWPSQEHPYFQKTLASLEWVLEEQVSWYKAWLADEPMPYGGA